MLKKCLVMLLFLVMAAGGAGCSATELEHRSFPLAVGIDLQEEPVETPETEEDEVQEVFHENE